MSTVLREIERMIDTLDATERRKLLEYLTPATTDGPGDAAEAWQQFRNIGHRLARLSGSGGSITDSVSEMRR